MKFNMAELNPGAWFSFDEQDPDAGRICLRILTTDAREQITKQTTKKCVEYKRGERYEYTEVDDDAYSRLMWDYCIVDWEHLEDEDGKPIECTADNKVKLVKGHPGFAAFLGECLECLTDCAKLAKEKAEKN